MIPPGIYVASPHHRDGWNVTLTEGRILEYNRDNQLALSNAPLKVTWEALDPIYTVTSELILSLDLEVRFDCQIPPSNFTTIYNGLYTFWFPTMVHYSAPGTLEEVATTEISGVGTGSGEEAVLTAPDTAATYRGNPYASPFLEVTSTEMCTGDPIWHSNETAWVLTEAELASKTYVMNEIAYMRDMLRAELDDLRTSVRMECMLEDDGGAQESRRRLQSADCFSLA
eukprot:scaffold8518_cov277-Pinguiococcus_pyrenoidosus.AAC.4